MICKNVEILEKYGFKKYSEKICYHTLGGWLYMNKGPA